ncbi:MAG: FAD-dependent oxidoreductase [Proteobacteria bacterium]|nr:FAD-dependent oxidoreductase [Pseudomonadota bacterium]
MRNRRIPEHPILQVPQALDPVPFYWEGQRLEARPGEMISSALFAAGIHIFGHHSRDDAPLGMFCANGQCAQCTVVANGVAVKSCMVPVTKDMVVEPCSGLPSLPEISEQPPITPTQTRAVAVLIIGAGPAGLSAAIELGKKGVDVLLVDDKDRPGGKLVLQTHKFFGSVEDTQAGTRGIDIADSLAGQLDAMASVEMWLSATAVGVFVDKKVGVVRQGQYYLIEPEVMLIATGARERQIPFPGHTLPGVYGAGAFQTLLNRDLVRPCERLLVLGGGNVGLIAAYHALQADIEVVGVVEAMASVGGYKVHADKIQRLGVELYLSHTVLAAHGTDHLEAVTIAEVDANFQVLPDTEKTFATDTLLVAVGLAPLDEFLHQAQAYGMKVHGAGDAAEIAEASAATFAGRIAAQNIARDLGDEGADIPEEWMEKLDVLKARPGHDEGFYPPVYESESYPVIRCSQEIPCNPCATVCPTECIYLEGHPISWLTPGPPGSVGRDSSTGNLCFESASVALRPRIMGLPRYTGQDCSACNKCVSICPGLAISTVNGRKDPENPIVTVPFELDKGHVEKGTQVMATDHRGVPIGYFEVIEVRNKRFQDRTLLVKVKASRAIAPHIAGIRVQDPDEFAPIEPVPMESTPDDVVVCRCEHVTAGEIRQAIRSGMHDVNELKAALRVCMGACCGKNCPEHIEKLYRDEGIEVADVTPPTTRPLFVEVPLGVFARGSKS